MKPRITQPSEPPEPSKPEVCAGRGRTAYKMSVFLVQGLITNRRPEDSEYGEARIAGEAVVPM
jgi:hypothetical protein